jgi:hypothetical protein
MGHFMLPFYTINAPGLLGIKNTCIAWVPLDDENTMVWNIGRQVVMEPGTEGIGGLKAGYNRQDPLGRFDPYGGRVRGAQNRKYAESTTDWLGRFRPLANKDNDYLIDRELQASMGTYSGVPNPAQDPMAQETMGAIYDRTQEHLGATDQMIIRTRRRLITACKAFVSEGVSPPGVDKPQLYRMRGGGAIVPRGVNGIDATWDVHFDRAQTVEIPVPNA